METGSIHHFKSLYRLAFLSPIEMTDPSLTISLSNSLTQEGARPTALAISFVVVSPFFLSKLRIIVLLFNAFPLVFVAGLSLVCRWFVAGIFVRGSVTITRSGPKVSSIVGVANPDSLQTEKMPGTPLPARSPILRRFNIFMIPLFLGSETPPKSICSLPVRIEPGF